jgi:hypothetical protein
MENAQGSTTYPGTAARRNITIRRSRDRASDSRTPDASLRRRSLDRPRDVQYAVENERDFQGASAVVHTRRHGEELLKSQGGTLPSG